MVTIGGNVVRLAIIAAATAAAALKGKDRIREKHTRGGPTAGKRLLTNERSIVCMK